MFVRDSSSLTPSSVIAHRGASAYVPECVSTHANALSILSHTHVDTPLRHTHSPFLLAQITLSQIS